MTDDEQLAVGGQSSAKPITDFSQAVQVRAFAYPSTLFPSLVVFLRYVQKNDQGRRKYYAAAGTSTASENPMRVKCTPTARFSLAGVALAAA
jgi:hypothetical protein